MLNLSVETTPYVKNGEGADYTPPLSRPNTGKECVTVITDSTPNPILEQVPTRLDPETLCVRLQCPPSKDGQSGRCMWLSITPALLPLFQKAGWSVLEVLS